MRTDFPYIINAHEISHIPKMIMNYFQILDKT